jgi:sterol desaturase/sphingolipid hydroxylase (fatty acid hydroxylase superfamily)
VTYLIGLAATSLFVFVLERIVPRRPAQRALRPHLASDLLMLVFNGHFLGVALYMIATRWLLPPVDVLLARAHLDHALYRNVAAGWPLPLQIVTVLLVMDFAQWCIHNLLHRVSWLWTFHQVHHSVVDGEMDWIVSFRFHWGEVVVYKTLQYLPLAFFGFSGTAAMVHAIFGTLIGHLNHANLDWGYGPWRYLLNNPRMHLWHHDYDARPGEAKNFGIIFSCWDYLFGTAHVPAIPPRALGFPGVEQTPSNFWSEMAWPLQRLFRTGKDGPLAVGTGIALVAVALALFFVG